MRWRRFLSPNDRPPDKGTSFHAQFQDKVIFRRSDKFGIPPFWSQAKFRSNFRIQILERDFHFLRCPDFRSLVMPEKSV